MTAFNDQSVRGEDVLKTNLLYPFAPWDPCRPCEPCKIDCFVMHESPQEPLSDGIFESF